MKTKLVYLFSIFSLLLFSSCNNTSSPSKDTKVIKNQVAERIVSLNGTITEILLALDKDANLVGRDVTSTYPEWIKDSVKDLGHVRSLNFESLLTLKPTLILASSSDLPIDLSNSIKDYGVAHKFFEQEYSVEGAKSLIAEVADFIGHEGSKSLIDKIDRDLKNLKTFNKKPKVLFLYARGAGTLMVAGEGTPMERMIHLAGAENAVNGFKNFKPYTQEALLNSNPDVILFFDSGLESLGGKEGFLNSTPSISQTNAGKKAAIISMDGGLLSDFGPRLGEAVYTLNKSLTEHAE